MIKLLFTDDQFKTVFEFYINDDTEQMSRGQFTLLKWIQSEDEVREEIDRYDENLYEVLAPYVLDEDVHSNARIYDTTRRNGVDL